MNYLILTLGFVCLAMQANGGAIERFAGLREKCAKKIGLDKRDLAESSAKFLENPKVPCYLRCFVEGINLFKSDDSLDPEETMKNVDESIRDQARPFIIECIDKNKHIVGRCEKIFASINCLSKVSDDIMLQLGLLEPAKNA